MMENMAEEGLRQDAVAWLSVIYIWTLESPKVRARRLESRLVARSAALVLAALEMIARVSRGRKVNTVRRELARQAVVKPRQPPPAGLRDPDEGERVSGGRTDALVRQPAHAGHGPDADGRGRARDSEHRLVAVRSDLFL